LTPQFLLLLSSLLIKSNKFGFLLFARRDGVIVRSFENDLGASLYGFSQAKLNGAALNPFEMYPLNAQHVKTLHTSENYVVREILILKGKTFFHYEEVNLVLKDKQSEAEDLFMKIIFFDGLSHLVGSEAAWRRDKKCHSN